MVLTIIDLGHAGVAGAVGAAEKRTVEGLGAVPDHPTSAVTTNGGESLDGAFEGIEEKGLPTTRRDLERFVVGVTAGGTRFHGNRWIGEERRFGWGADHSFAHLVPEG